MDHEAGSFCHLMRWVVLGAIVASVLGLAIAPGTASAFTGESVVLNPGKTDLTGPAKTIIENPTFLPDSTDGAAALGGAQEASGAAGVFEASTLLPALGSVISFGVGTVVGSEICHVIGIAGCWYFGSEGADPSESTTGGSWVFKSTAETKAGFGEREAFVWVWQLSGGSIISTYKGMFGNKETCGQKAPVTRTGGWQTANTNACGTGGEGEALRQAMANRNLDYHASDSGAVSNYEPGGKPYEANAKWSEKMASALKEKSDSMEAGRLGEHIASQVAGSGIADPYPHEVTVPSCSGEAWVECKADLEELELVPKREELSWEDAHLDLAPDEVVELSPVPGTQIMVPSEKTTVIVTTNPDEAGMPVVVPQPEPGETYSHYAARLNPSLTAERHDLEAAFVSPSTGPNGVVSVDPAPESRLDPSTSHSVKVTTNPADAPVAVPAWSPPVIPSLDMTPLMSVGTPCSVFPFGLLCWLGEGLGQFNTTGVCPHTAVPVGDGANFELSLCGETTDTVMGYFRPVVLFVWVIGCAFLFAKATRAIGGGD